MVFKRLKNAPFCVADIESYLDSNNEWVFKLGYVFDGCDFYKSTSVLELYRNISRLNKPVYFHNLDFDGLFFFRDNDIMSFTVDCELIQSGNMILGFLAGTVYFKNSLSLLPMPLKKIVSDLLLVNDNEYFNQKENVLDLSDDELNLYCKKDCFYLYKALLEYYEFVENLGGKVKLTTPATSLNLFENVYNKTNFLDKWNREKNFFKVNYYFGGHTEKFIENKKVFRNVYYYDIRSLYPFIMRDIKIIEDKKVSIQPSLKNIKKLIKENECFYCEIDLKIDSEYLRFFPVFCEDRKSNSYPLGTYTIKVSEVGVNFIIKYGSLNNIVNVHRVMVSKNYVLNKKSLVCKPFTNFVDSFFELRKVNKAYNIIAKLFLNSLYGKFGQRLEINKKIINRISKRDDQPVSKMKFADNCFIETFKEETGFWNHYLNRLDVAGKITEGARLYMGELINSIRLETGLDSIIYTDTDSIITYTEIEKHKKLKSMVHSKIGGFEREIKEKDNVIILGVKMYHFYKSGKKATKGIKNMKLEDFKAIIRGKTKFENERFTKLFTFVTKGFFGIQTVPYEHRKILERLDFSPVINKEEVFKNVVEEKSKRRFKRITD